MENKAKLILVKNAFANVIRGSAAALVALVLPPFLTRFMSSDAYGVWALILQLSAYVGYLDFGIQTAVARFVAHANERSDTDYRDRIVNTSLTALSAVGVFAIFGTGVLTIFLPHLFKQIPPVLLGDARVALVLVGGALAVGLPASVFNGIFVGLQRNEVPAAVIGGSRLISAVLLIAVVFHGGSLRQMGVATAAIYLASYFLQYVTYRRLAPDIRLSPHLVSAQTGRDLFDYCWSLTIWSFGMLLVTGLDVTLVGYFQFQSVAYYAVAASLVTFIAGLQNAVFNAMIPATAVLHARGDSAELGRVMITATRYGTFLLLLVGLPIIFFAKTLLSVWVGPNYAAHGARFLQILVAANIIRLSATPYVVTLIGAGQQRLVTVTPLLEGFSNLFMSITAGYLLGAVGVALGTLFGSFVGVGGNFFYNMRRTTSLEFKISDYLRDGLLRPTVCSIPFCLFTFAIHWVPHVTSVSTGAFMILATLATLSCFWYYGLTNMERDQLRPRQILALAMRGVHAQR